MKVTTKGQVTIPQEVREALGIQPAVSEVEFKRDKNGRWYLSKVTDRASQSRFRTAHSKARLRMTTEEIMALTRS